MSGWGIVVLPFLFFFVQPGISTGKGTDGVYAIDNRYILVTDSNLDHLLVLDSHRGGIVGSRNLSGLDLTGVASCDRCLKIFVTGNRPPFFFTLSLKISLKEMVEIGNFSTLSSAPMKGYWPWVQSLKTEPKVFLRMLEITQNGLAGFMVDYEDGVFQFDPSGKHVAKNHPLFMASQVEEFRGASGCTLTRSENLLLVAGLKFVYIFDLTNKDPESFKRIDVSVCDRRKNLHVRDVVMLRNQSTLYLVGHPRNGNFGSALYEFNIKTKKCTTFVGKHGGEPGWVDGFGGTARFTRPHAMTLLRNSDILVVTDMDNRVVRLVNLIEGDRHYGEVSTLFYSALELQNSTVPIATPSPIHLFRLKVTQSVDYLLAANLCEQIESHLCSASELRQSWFGSMESSEATSEPITTWIDESCHSCWLRHPGNCPKPPVNESTETRKGSSWGANYQMIAHLYEDGRIQTLCQEKTLSLAQPPLCCAGPKQIFQQNLTTT